MGHSTASGRTQTGGAAKQNTLDNYRENEVARLVGRGIGERDAERIADVNSMREAIKRFESIYEATRDSTPALTAERLRSELGDEWSNAVVRTLVNSAQGDGRISGENSRWAGSSDARGVYSPNETRENRLYTNVHKAHLDQIATEFRRRSEASQIGRDNFGNQVLRRNNRSR